MFIFSDSNNSPQFSHEKYHFYLTKNEEENTYIRQVFTTDRDICPTETT